VNVSARGQAAQIVQVPVSGGVTWNATGERSHAINVLEHESKVFNFEQGLTRKANFR